MIVPSIDIRGGQAVQLVGGEGPALEAGDPRPLLERFRRVGEVAVVDLDAATAGGENGALVEALCRMAPVRVGGGIRDLDAARRWLDAGAHKIVLGTAARRDLLAQLPKERVIAALDAVEGEVVVEGWKTKTGASIAERMRALSDVVGGFLVTFVEREGRMEGTDLERVKELVQAAGDARLTIAGGVTTAEEVAALDALGVDAQVGMALYTGKLDLAEAFAAPLESDRPDGLWPTVVVDPQGRALGQCFSNLESLRAAIDEGRGIYWSRRRGLWRKGEKSGDVQALLGVAADCDRDALRFVVEQSGRGFCHRGTDSCWGDLGGLPALLRTLRSRLSAPPPGSYTRRLLDDPDLLHDKLVEEAGELADAEGEREVTWEAADLIYFASVAMARAGVDLADVEAELDRRARGVTRRKGDAKPEVQVEVRPVADVGVARDVAGVHDVADDRDVRAPGGVQAVSRDAIARAESLDLRLRRLSPTDVRAEGRSPVDPDTLAEAREIVQAVEREGDEAVRRYVERFDECVDGAPRVRESDELRMALDRLDHDTCALLERTAERIERFAEAQRRSLHELDVAIDGGRAGHRVLPVSSAGCYAPGGRYALPSSVLMTAVTARAAGVERVWVACPAPTDVTLAAAAIAGADAVVVAGGAHVIAALAFGTALIPAVDVIVGPGNRWVTAAKQLVSSQVGIDMLAGPSELVVVADGTDPALIAADLLAQAEHDPEALPVLVVFDEEYVEQVERALASQLPSLPTAEVARAALDDAYAVICDDDAEAVAVCDQLAPEHLQLCGTRAEALASRVSRYGALFVGERAGEVLGDYGAGPNHVLPTGGSARHTAGLSVLTFLKTRSWLTIDEAEELSRDAAALARLEGLAAHARAADRRR